MKINLNDYITEDQIQEAERMEACENSIKWLREAPRRWCDLTEEQMAWALSQTPELTKALLKAGADVHTWEDLALRWAAFYGYPEVVKILLEAGADVHAWEDYALRLAAQNGHTEVVKLLLKAGADVYAWEDEALRWATWHGHTRIVKILEDWVKEHG